MLLASDDLDDIIDQGWYLYSGTLDQALDEGYFADLYEYRHLMPNFMWEIHERSKTNPDVMNTMFYKKSHKRKFIHPRLLKAVLSFNSVKK